MDGWTGLLQLAAAVPRNARALSASRSSKPFVASEPAYIHTKERSAIRSHALPVTVKLSSSHRVVSLGRSVAPCPRLMALRHRSAAEMPES